MSQETVQSNCPSDRKFYLSLVYAQKSFVLVKITIKDSDEDTVVSKC